MKRYLVALLLVCSITVMAQQPAYPPPMWEYKFDDKCSEKRSNELASQGWELFSMSMGAWRDISTPTCVFRRARKS